MRIGNVGMSNSDFLKSQLPFLDTHLLFLKLHKLQSFMTLVHVQFKVELTPGPLCGWKDYVSEMTPLGIKPATFQPTNQPTAP